MPHLDLAYRACRGVAGPVERVHVIAPAEARRWVRAVPAGDAPAWAELTLDDAALTLTFAVQPGVLHFLRLADATLAPLPPAHPPARHAVLPWQARWHGPTLHLAPGDCYVLASPGVARIADSPRVARFVHLRDYFNAEKLAETLMAHLLEGHAEPPPEPFTVLVVEAR